MTSTASVRYEPMVARTRLIGRVETKPVFSEQGFVWWHDGRGLMTEGVARRVPVSSVHDVLSAIEVEAWHPVPGTGPIAVGALGFDPNTASTAEMVVPARVRTFDVDGRVWLTEISGGTHGGEPPGPQGDSGPRPPDVRSATSRCRAGRDMSRSQWGFAVGEALGRIEAGELEKVVLARRLSLTCETEFSIVQTAERLVATQSGCYVFAAEGLVGASPELLVERRGEMVRSRPMAGTVPHNDPEAIGRLANSSKDRWEHTLVVDAVVRCLAPRCDEPLDLSGPAAQPFADLSHLATDVRGRLSFPAPSALELALELHPTPAVAGAPTEAALVLISTLETGQRGRYAGPVGWVGANGDGEFALALRCAQIEGRRAVLYAGAGIVEGSRWEEEWRETEAKLAPILRALVLR